MTPEATLAKLSYILAKEGLTTEERKKLLVTNLRGELTRPDMKRLTLSSSTFLSKVAASLRTEFIEHMCDFTTGNSWWYQTLTLTWVFIWPHMTLVIYEFIKRVSTESEMKQIKNSLFPSLMCSGKLEFFQFFRNTNFGVENILSRKDWRYGNYKNAEKGRWWLFCWRCKFNLFLIFLGMKSTMIRGWSKQLLLTSI